MEAIRLQIKSVSEFTQLEKSLIQRRTGEVYSFHEIINGTGRKLGAKIRATCLAHRIIKLNEMEEGRGNEILITTRSKLLVEAWKRKTSFNSKFCDKTYLWRNFSQRHCSTFPSRGGKLPRMHFSSFLVCEFWQQLLLHNASLMLPTNLLEIFLQRQSFIRFFFWIHT